MKTHHITVSGRVQGVGFRYFTVNQALENEIKGTVENAHDTGNVEIYCQGEDEQISKFIIAIRKGPQLSRVDNISVNELEMDGFQGFRVK